MRALRLRSLPGPRFRRAPRKLRTRLTLGLAVLLTVIFAGVGVATTHLVGRFLVDRLDQQVTQAGPRYAASLEHGGTGGTGGRGGEGSSGSGGVLGSDTRAQAPGTFGARLLGGAVTNAGVVDGDADDTVTTADGQPADTDDRVVLTTADRDALASLPMDGAPHTVRLSAIGSYRLAAIRGQDGDKLITGLPMSHVEGTVHQLAAAELILFAVAVGLAAAAGAAWVRYSLRPLDRVARTAERVSALPLASGEVALSVRVPDEDPDTEVGRVGAALNRMLGHVEAALEQRHAVEERLRAFAADAGHELRTPVSTIRGHAELALRRPAPLPDEVRHALTRIEAESQRMSVIVDDLLLLARLDAGRPLEHTEVDLTRVVLDAVEDARAAAPDHRWRLALPEEPTIVPGDTHRLAQAVLNLVTNARVHTPAGTEVTVAVEDADDLAADQVRVQVTDDGPGLDPVLAEQAFDRFTRGDRARSRAAGSTGLGLAITRAIAEAHGGHVEVSSRPGRTTFTLTLKR